MMGDGERHVRLAILLALLVIGASVAWAVL